MTGHVATAEVHVDAAPDRVWQALTDPDQIAEYMMGSRVTTDWQIGSPITWAGEYEGKSFEDKGEVLEFQPGERLRVTHYSPMSGAEDLPENYHRLTYQLTADGAGTQLTLTQDGNGSADEAEHAAANWQSMMDGLKSTIEGTGPATGTES